MAKENRVCRIPAPASRSRGRVRARNKSVTQSPTLIPGFKPRECRADATISVCSVQRSWERHWGWALSLPSVAMPHYPQITPGGSRPPSWSTAWPEPLSVESVMETRALSRSRPAVSASPASGIIVLVCHNNSFTEGGILLLWDIWGLPECSLHCVFRRPEEQEALCACRQESPGSSSTVAARPVSFYNSHPEQEVRRAQVGGPSLKPRWFPAGRAKFGKCALCPRRLTLPASLCRNSLA